MIFNLKDTHSAKITKLAHGAAEAEKIYVAMINLIRWWRGYLFDPTAAAAEAEAMVLAMGTSAAGWFRSLELACRFVRAADQLRGEDDLAPSVVPEGWSYTINDDGTVTLSDEGGAEPIKLAAAGESPLAALAR